MTAPSRKVYVAATAATTAFGDGVDPLWTALMKGYSAARPVDRFSTSGLAFHNAATLPGLDTLDPPPGDNRLCALLDRALDQLAPLAPPPDTFLIWTGVKGWAEWIEERSRREHEQPESTEPPEMPYLPEHYRRRAAHRLGLDPANGMEINAACASSTAGLALAAGMIASGERRSVLVCAADIVSRFIFTGFSSLKALSPARCRPFDARRDGLCLGDGAAAILLCDAKTTERLGLEPLGTVAGWGLANDANHITGPARDGCGLTAAIRSALGDLAPEAVAAFCAHGTGTPFNDAMELTSLETLFAPRRFPLFSVKGAIGHTLGAAGAIEAALCLRALKEKTAPPTAGLQEPEDRAQGRALDQPQPIEPGPILTTNSGFGGVNAALLLEV